MVRIAFIVLLLVTLAATSARAARINPVPVHPHANISKSTVHHARRPIHPTATHPSRTAPRTSHSFANPRTSRNVSARGKRYATSAGHRATPSSSHAASLRRTRYNGYRSSARFVPQPAFAASGPQTERRSAGTDPAAGTEPAAGTGLAIDSATASPAELPATEPKPSSTSSFESASAPRDAEPSASDGDVPAETDTLPASGTDRAGMTAAGNPLATPREGRQAISPASGQLAELYRPPIFSGRVSSYTLRGTHDSLVRQNARSEEESLERIEDDADLQDRIARGLLVRVPESSALTVNAALPEDRRYCRPWTANFLRDIARAHQTQFHAPLVVSSAVRTVEYQKQLMRINGNAADAEGDVVSPHLTGATIDIAKSGLSRKEMLWMRNQLLGYQNAGVIDVEEEFHQRCFHITVYKNYVSKLQSRGSAKSSLATPLEAPSSADIPPSDQ